MPNLVWMSGPYGPVLVVLSVVVVYISIRASALLLYSSEVEGPVLRERLNGLLFWGSVAAVVGFLGQCQGTYIALDAILAASEISAQVVAEGFVISFIPALFGFGIFAFSLAAWGCLTLMARGRSVRPAAAGPILFTLGFLLLGGCSPNRGQELPSELTQGVWSFDTGPDLFLWEFTSSEAGLTCVVHDMVGPVKLNETPCERAELDGSRVRVTMDTGVRLEGEVRLAQGSILGHLTYPDGSDMEVELPWSSRDRFPALHARGNEEGPYTYRVPEDRGDGWEVGHATEVGLAPEALEDLVAAVDQGEVGVLHSFLVVRDGLLVLDEYFHGYQTSDPHHIASCTKSVSSLLLGMAIQEGAISGVEAKVSDFFPDLADIRGAGWDQLNLDHLLTMSMALDWSPEEAENLHGTGPEFFGRVLSRSVSGKPGEDWEYVSANTDLIAGILRQATGQHAEAFARRTLFEPLGFGAWDWKGLKTDGYNLMDGSLRLLPRDMAKLGQMVLDGGRWRGHSIVDEEWIRTSTTWRFSTGEDDWGYGYLWWLGEATSPAGDPAPVVFANGWGSQFIAVFPTLDMVVVTTGGNEYNGMHLAVAGALQTYLIPGIEPPVD